MINITDGVKVIDGWQGIPEAIFFNFILATILLIILAILRTIYFHRKMEPPWDTDWLQFIYSDRNVNLLHDANMINPLHPYAYVAPWLLEYANRVTCSFNGTETIDPKLSAINPNDKTLEQIKKKHQERLDQVGKHRHWLLDYICIKDQDIFEHRGKDAFNYLLFQRYIIYYLAILTMVCLLVLIPLHLNGEKGLNGYFEMTTINNIKENSPKLWVNTIVAMAMVILGIILMKKFSDRIFSSQEEQVGRTILIQNVPESMLNAHKLKQYIETHFLGVEVTRITFTYDNYYGKTLRVAPPYPSTNSWLCGICYYQEMIAQTRILIKKEAQKTLTMPKHAVFVQLKTNLMMQRILDHFDYTQHTRLFNRICRNLSRLVFRDDSDSDESGYNRWKTQPAPFPEDVEWSDVVMDNRTLFSVLLNLLIIIIFLFLTTPIVAMNLLQEFILLLGIDKSIKEIQATDIKIGNFQISSAKYFSALVLNGFAGILPNLILLIEYFVPQSSKSEKNSKIMKMVYLFLILMVVIFPSLGIMSGQLLIEKMFKKTLPSDFFKCFFPATSSQFFVYYVISCVFLNNAAQLLRLPELAMYMLNCIIYPKTEAEYERARIETSFKFSYGSSYPRFLLVFTIVTTFSIACPILAPLGFLYMVFKHLVDRYSLYYLYSTQVINANIHQNAISFVSISFFFLLFQLTTFMNTNSLYSLTFKPSNICTIALVIYILFMLYACFNLKNIYRKNPALSRSYSAHYTVSSNPYFFTKRKYFIIN